jgi:toxin ParE1/3/4
MANYRLTNKAVEDLSNIWIYTCEKWSEQQADRYYSLLLNTCKELSAKPDFGKKYDEIFPSLRGYKAYSHIVFYTIVSEKEIKIVRILHSRMDLQKRLTQ